MKPFQMDPQTTLDAENTMADAKNYASEIPRTAVGTMWWILHANEYDLVAEVGFMIRPFVAREIISKDKMTLFPHAL